MTDEGLGLGTQLAAEMLTGLIDNVPSTSELHGNSEHGIQHCKKMG